MCWPSSAARNWSAWRPAICAGSAGASVQSLNFHDGLLELTLNAPDAASLDHLSQQLRNGGWQADLIGGNTVGSAYQGRVQIHSQGP